MIEPSNRRIIVIDDNEAIYEDFKKILSPNNIAESTFGKAKALLFDETDEILSCASFELDYASQGEQGIEKIMQAKEKGNPYSMAFVDVRMPPGMDGIETVANIWKLDPDIQIVICTAYSDYSWSDMVDKLGNSSDLLILKKPFDTIEVNQLAHALTQKWGLMQLARMEVKHLENRVQERTSELAIANKELLNKIQDYERMEVELRHAQKLEAVGQLAAGIAHEINTPVQYLGDSVHFLNNSYNDILQLVNEYKVLFSKYIDENVVSEVQEEIDEKEDDADLEYIREQVPAAFERTFDGIDRVSTIVRAMKEFAHPDQRTKSFADINKGLENTLIVCRNEYKYIADVEINLGNIPQVECHLGDMNQVFLNLMVNAAHAIESNRKTPEERGKITLSTSQQGDRVLIKISDTGSGIPEKAQPRIFDPFFTTKEIGKGTGQGLAIAHSIIVDKHSGELTFETEGGVGTTFMILIPIKGEGCNENEVAA